MPIDLNTSIVAALDQSHPACTWMVLPGRYTDHQPECQAYGSAASAHRTLLAAGYEVTNRFVAVPSLDGVDAKSILRYERGDLRVILGCCPGS